MPATTKIDRYDALTLEIERAELLTEHLEGWLSALASRSDTPNEIRILELIAGTVYEKLGDIHAKARTLYEGNPQSKGGGR